MNQPHKRRKHFFVWQISLFFLCMLCLKTFAQQAPLSNQQITDLLSQARQPGLGYQASLSILNKALPAAKKNRYLKGEVQAYDLLAELAMANGRIRETAKYDSLLAPALAQLGDSILLANHYNRQGVYSMETGKNSEAEKNFNAALNSGLGKNATVKTAEIYSNLGSLYLARGEKEKAVERFFNSLRLYESNGNESGIAETYSNISSVYYLMGKTDDAIGYQQRSIEIREKIGDKKGLVTSATNIGQLFILKGDNVKALQYLENAVRIADQTSNSKTKGIAYGAMSVYNIRTKNFNEALKWQTKSIALFEELDDRHLLSRMYVAAGGLANAVKDSQLAVDYYNQGLKLSKELGNKENIANAYDKLSGFYLLHSDYKLAYDYYKSYIVYRDSITERSNIGKMEEVRSLYETEKKDNEIKRLNTLQQLKQLEIDKQNAMLAGNLLEARQKQSEIELLLKEKELQGLRISEQDKELERQSLLAKNKEQQLQLAEQEQQLQKRLLKNQAVVRNLLLAGLGLVVLMALILFNRFKLKRKVQQQEALLAVRNSISKDLHDDIGASLSNIGILNEMARRSLAEPEKSKDYLLKASEDIQRISEALSDIVWNVNPKFDNPEGLFIRMRRYAADILEGAGIKAAIDLPDDTVVVKLSMQQRRDFYLIFKEAINNLVKYSGAAHAAVNVSAEKNCVILLVKDDGKGFDPAVVRSGNGLTNMQQRAIANGANLTVNSQVGGGTSVQLVMNLL